jgi:hypothetical protein
VDRAAEARARLVPLDRSETPHLPQRNARTVPGEGEERRHQFNELVDDKISARPPVVYPLREADESRM